MLLQLFLRSRQGRFRLLTPVAGTFTLLPGAGRASSAVRKTHRLVPWLLSLFERLSTSPGLTPSPFRSITLFMKLIPDHAVAHA